MRHVLYTTVAALIGVLMIGGCSTAPTSAVDRAELAHDVQRVIERCKKEDPGVARFFDKAAGYAIFPTVGKGAIGIGGAYGKGELYEGGKMVGYCDLTQATIGLALGGQAYSEIIFFETPHAIAKFKSGEFAFAAQASAVAIKSGASGNAKYADEILVFSLGETGLMYEASVGGQKFSYEPRW